MVTNNDTDVGHRNAVLGSRLAWPITTTKLYVLYELRSERGARFRLYLHHITIWDNLQVGANAGGVLGGQYTRGETKRGGGHAPHRSGIRARRKSAASHRASSSAATAPCPCARRCVQAALASDHQMPPPSLPLPRLQSQPCLVRARRVTKTMPRPAQAEVTVHPSCPTPPLLLVLVLLVLVLVLWLLVPPAGHNNGSPHHK